MVFFKTIINTDRERTTGISVSLRSRIGNYERCAQIQFSKTRELLIFGFEKIEHSNFMTPSNFTLSLEFVGTEMFPIADDCD